MEDSEKHGAVGVLSEDEEIQQRVCASLIEASELDSRRIEVRTQSGTVMLAGAVRSREDWLRALRIARQQEGVEAVNTEALLIDQR
jgi:osmotically-inducible protein OsmY